MSYLWHSTCNADVTDLQKFVHLSLASAVEGDGDKANDMLSHLHTVGRGYGPMLYGLDGNAGHSSLIDSCKAVWSAMKEAPNLATLLVSSTLYCLSYILHSCCTHLCHVQRDCNSDLEWYKDLKKRQGSVEETSFGQLENILKYGMYKVGSSRHLIPQSTEEVVQLVLKVTDRQLSKMNYSLDDLQDLESKLVLITGNKAQNRQQVDIFLDVSATLCRYFYCVNTVLYPLMYHRVYRKFDALQRC